MSENAPHEVQQTLAEHLIELRTRLIRALAGVILCFVVLFPFAQEIYTFVAQPLMDALPGDNPMIATDVAATFFVPVKVTFMVAFLIALPNTGYQIWAFVAPALYQNEKNLVLPLILSTVFLFFLGMAFAYYLVFPVIFHFLSAVTPAGVSMMTDIGKYISFVLGMFTAFGIAFEVPVIVLILNRTGIVSLDKLKEIRPYVIVLAFVVAAIVTPPDILSQIMLAVPLIILYEFGLFLCRFVRQKSRGIARETEVRDAG